MKLTNLINNLLSDMTPLGLEDVASSCALMDRVDTKFILPVVEMVNILPLLQQEYNVLEIGAERIMSYASTYFDMPNLQLQRWHQNGKRKRTAIRVRHYLNNKRSFLEVKHKNNKGRTIKHRIDNSEDRLEKQQFVRRACNLDLAQMVPHSHNRFSRITLVHPQRAERLTIDVNLQFSKNAKTWHALGEIAVVELKASCKTSGTFLFKLMKAHGIYPANFSKYIVGMYVNKVPAKLNRYKSLFRTIEIFKNGSIDSSQSTINS